MSVWNSLLQSLHSSLIDELNAQFPKDKLELGLPKRHDGWFAPANLENLNFARVNFKTGEAGIVCLNVPLKLKASDFWGKTLGRAQTEFKRRSIEPLFEEMTPSLPAASTTMILWMPVKLPNPDRFFDLGIGVY